MTQSVEVLPSLTVTPRLTPTSDSLHRSLLQLTVAQPQVCSVTHAPPTSQLSALTDLFSF